MGFFNSVGSITRPANTTQYAAGDLIANSATPASVVLPTFNVGRATNAAGLVHRVRLHKSAASATAASFTLHLWEATPTLAIGDNTAYAIAAQLSGYLGSVAIDMSSGASAGSSTGLVETVDLTNPFSFDLKDATDKTLFGALVAVGTYTPASAEVFTITLGIEF